MASVEDKFELPKQPTKAGLTQSMFGLALVLSLLSFGGGALFYGAANVHILLCILLVALGLVVSWANVYAAAKRDPNAIHTAIALFFRQSGDGINPRAYRVIRISKQ